MWVCYCLSLQLSMLEIHTWEVHAIKDKVCLWGNHEKQTEAHKKKHDVPMLQFWWSVRRLEPCNKTNSKGAAFFDNMAAMQAELGSQWVIVPRQTCLSLRSLPLLLALPQGPLKTDREWSKGLTLGVCLWFCMVPDWEWNSWRDHVKFWFAVSGPFWGCPQYKVCSLF